MEDHPRIPQDLRPVVMETVERTRQRSGWSLGKVLSHLGIPRSTYHGWKSVTGSKEEKASPLQSEKEEKWNPYQALPEERQAIVAYARSHTDLRHREMAWKMVDEGVACVSPSTVYRILLEENLVHRWERKAKREKRVREKPLRPDERWQSDIHHVRVGKKTYYLITFMDEYSRAIPHHELMMWMDGNAVSLELEKASEGLPEAVRPVVQTDNGSGYISREFKIVLTEKGIGHHRIHPHCPEENGMIERSNRTIEEKLSEVEIRSYEEARRIIALIIHWYNHERFHSAIGYLPPWVMYRGDPEALQEERRRKLECARQHRKEENLKSRKSSLSLSTKEENHNLFQRAICPN